MNIIQKYINLNHQKSDGITTSIFSMVRGSRISVWNSLAMASGNKGGEGPSNEKSQRISGQIRITSPKANRGSGADHKDSSRNDFQISEWEKRYLKNKRKINRLQKKLQEQVFDNFAGGKINNIPSLLGKVYRIPGGFEIKLLYNSKTFDVYIFSGEAGNWVQTHSHKQVQYLKVLTGKLSLTLGGEKRVLTPEDDIVIPAGVERKMEVPENTKLLIIFQPPISVDPSEDNGENYGV